MKKLSKPRVDLLRKLFVYDELRAEQLTVPDRRLATRMQSDGLVEWFGGSSRHTCLGQNVRITAAGRYALNAFVDGYEGDDPCHGPQDTTCDSCGLGATRTR